MPQATDSQIAMWRGAIALAWADGKLAEGEKARLLEYFKDNIYLSDVQRAELTKDLEQPVQLKDVWDSITDMQDRAHLIDIAPDIFWAGGSYTSAEHEIYDKMFADQMAHVDIKKVKQDMDEMAAKIPADMTKLQAEFEQEKEGEFDHLGLLGRLAYRFEKTFGVDDEV